MPDVHLYLHINPQEYTQLPLKRFYRYNVLANLGFDSEGYVSWLLLDQPLISLVQIGIAFSGYFPRFTD